MKTSTPARKCILFFLFLLIGFSASLFFIIYFFGPHYSEPEYQGKKLTEWAKEIDPMDFFRLPAYQQHPQQNEQATIAIERIGTNALPVALDLLAAKDSWFKMKLEGWAERYNDYDWPNQRWYPIYIKSADKKHFEGINIIWALGSATKPIVPDLVQLLQSKDREIAEDIMLALPGAGTNAIPPLLELLDNPDKNVRLRAAIALGDFFRPKMPPDEAGDLLVVAGSEDFRSQASAAVPVLLQSLDNQKLNSVLRNRAIHALGLIRESAPVVVPVLIRRIQSETNGMTDYISRENYFWALGRYGTNAESAVPILVNILESMAESSNNLPFIPPMVALQKINPEVARPFMEKWKVNQINSTGLPAH